MRTRWLWVAGLPLVWTAGLPLLGSASLPLVGSAGLSLLWGASLSGERLRGQAASSPAQVDSFEATIRPILAANCYDCHSDQRMGGLRVDSREALLKGGRTGPAIVPGDPDKSLLIQAVRQTGTLKMPKGGVLRPDEVTALAEWVKAGAKWGDAVPTATAEAKAAATSTPAPAAPGYVIKPEQRAFWSFQPLKKPPVPAVSHDSWPKTDIDRFVLARLEREGLTPVRAA